MWPSGIGLSVTASIASAPLMLPPSAASAYPASTSRPRQMRQPARARTIIEFCSADSISVCGLLIRRRDGDDEVIDDVDVRRRHPAHRRRCVDAKRKFDPRGRADVEREVRPRADLHVGARRGGGDEEGGRSRRRMPHDNRSGARPIGQTACLSRH